MTLNASLDESDPVGNFSKNSKMSKFDNFSKMADFKKKSLHVQNRLKISVISHLGVFRSLQFT